MKQREQVPREQRMPLYVRVVTQPPLASCWSVNISMSGLGLVASRAPAQPLPREGDLLELQLDLPDSGSTLRARTEVTWRHDAPAEPGAASEDHPVAIGVVFRDLEAADRLLLSRYLHGYRFQVAVVHASPSETNVIRASLDEANELHFAEDRARLAEVLARGDIAAVVVCGDDERTALGLVEQITAGDAALPPGIAATEVAPRVLCAAATPAERLVPLWNGGKLFRVLAPPLLPDSLRSAVAAACGEYGVRIEQRRVALALERALLRERARARPRRRIEHAVDALVGCDSPPMKKMLEAVRLVAPHRVSVLFQGETGSGKEVAARTLHALNERANAPFVALDCGALTETLLESELFGHVKGSFTGAGSDHPGLFAIAEGGTIFLDEIENTTANFQAKLLRVLETSEVRPVGGTNVRKVDVRVIAASNRDRAQQVGAGTFRVDLYYRLSRFPIVVPPLRERREDVMPLAEHFRELANDSFGRRVEGFSTAATSQLCRHPWPGNVRELRNVVERAVILADAARTIDSDLLPTNFAGRGPGATVGEPANLTARLDSYEREVIARTLEEHDGVLRRAAMALGVNPVTLGRRAKRLGLWPPAGG